MDELPSDYAGHDPRSGAGVSRIVDGVANWCEALNGSVSLQRGLIMLIRAVGADAGMIVRTHRSDFRPVAVASHDVRVNSVERPLRMSFADGYFGTPMRAPRSASVWVGSIQANEDSADCDPALREWQGSRRLKEFIVLVLAGGPAQRDHIELHFAQHLTPDVLHTLSALLPTLSRTWAARQVGLVTRTVVNHRHDSRRDVLSGLAAPILSPMNPARLSRAEFRVCLLLSRGLSVAGVSDELKLSDATIRTHLRNTYAKVNTGSLAELVFLLMAPRNMSDLPQIRSA